MFKSLPLANQVWLVPPIGNVESGITPTLLVCCLPSQRQLLMLPLVPSPELFLEAAVPCPLLCLQVSSVGVKRGQLISVVWHCGQNPSLLLAAFQQFCS